MAVFVYVYACVCFIIYPYYFVFDFFSGIKTRCDSNKVILVDFCGF